jgi:type I restriction enzyme S subunit
VVFGDHTREIKYIDFDFIAGADGTKILRPILIAPQYFYLQLRSYRLENRGYGRHFKLLNEQLFSLPPLAEQHRIVAKVDELMALCDQLEQQSEQQLDAHQQLVETLLGTLTTARDAEELATNWQRLADHFDLLFGGALGGTAGAEWAIDRLKDTILQLAVMGKLVPPNPADEPASVLLHRIKSEKKRLVTEGKLREKKPLPPISEKEKPRFLPSHWECVRLGEIGVVKGGKRVPKGQSLTREKTPYVYIRVTDMKAQTVVTDDLHYITPEVYSEIRNYTISSDDVYITIAGTIGAVGTVPEQLDGVNLTENAAKIVMPMVNKYWLVNSLGSKQCQQHFSESVNQQAQPKLALNKIEMLPLGVPPLTEQGRIVAKVDEFFSLCDQLKAKVQEAAETQMNLSGALVERALS